MKIPYPPGSLEAGVRGYLTQLVSALTTITGSKIDRNTAGASLLLASPAGKVYTVTVTDAGVLETTLVYDGS